MVYNQKIKKIFRRCNTMAKNAMKQKMVAKEAAIKTFMESLEVTREEAEELYKFDNMKLLMK